VPPKILNDSLMKKIQVETVPISSARTLQNLLDARNNGDISANTFQSVIQAETVLSPLLDIMGIDGMSIALNSAAIRARFEHSDRGDLLARAKQIMEKYGSHEIVQAKVCDMLAALTDEYINENNVFYSRAHHVLLDSGDAAIDGKDVRFIWRRKGLGQLAQKLEKSLEKSDDLRAIEPMDFIGATIIIPPDDTGEIFAKTLQRIYDNSEDFCPTPSPSRQQAIHVRGSDVYRAHVMRHLHEADFAESLVQQKPDNRGMNLTKVTTFYKGLPIEIQFVDEEVRAMMRYGQVSHFGYKLDANLTSEDLASMEHIHARGEQISQAGLYAPISGNADKYMTRIAQLAIPRYLS
jgi:hypothetical protein